MIVQNTYTQNVTYKLVGYGDVLNKTDLLKSVGGDVISINVDTDRFNDKRPHVCHYTLVARLPADIAIRFC